MNNRIKHWLFGFPAALIASSLLVGCAHEAPAPAAPVAQATPAPEQQPGPGKTEGELVVATAKVEAINKKDRIITLKYPDGKKANIKCGPEVRNFPQIKVGDDVTAKFLETAELFVAGPNEKPTGGQTAMVKRAPKGSKPAAVMAESMEIPATVVDIDYNTRMVTLKGQDGRIAKVKASPEIKRLNEVKPGDTVVARFTKALSIQVTSPPAK